MLMFLLAVATFFDWQTSGYPLVTLFDPRLNTWSDVKLLIKVPFFSIFFVNWYFSLIAIALSCSALFFAFAREPVGSRLRFSVSSVVAVISVASCLVAGYWISVRGIFSDKTFVSLFIFSAVFGAVAVFFLIDAYRIFSAGYADKKLTKNQKRELHRGRKGNKRS